METPNKLLKAEDIRSWHTYYAKRPKNFIFGNDDRLVLWVSVDRTQIQYDSNSVRTGRKYPTCTMLAFLKWAGGERPMVGTEIHK